MLVAVPVVAVCQETSAQSAGPKARLPVVRQVDRILVQSSDPRSLYDFFTVTAALPVAWPLTESSGFASGGVGAGNVNIEVYRPADLKSTDPAGHSGARFTGIAFQPYPLDRCLPELLSRGIAYDPPQPLVSTLPDGSRGTLWTTVVLPQLSGPVMSVFLCEYSTSYLNVEVRRRQLGNQLGLKKGGPMRIESVKEVVVGTADLRSEAPPWRKLLGLAPASSPGVLNAGEGPAIRLVSGGGKRIQAILVKVASLKEAKEFLEGKRLLGQATANGISLNPSKIQGLRISLVEK